MSESLEPTPSGDSFLYEAASSPEADVESIEELRRGALSEMSDFSHKQNELAAKQIYDKASKALSGRLSFGSKTNEIEIQGLDGDKLEEFKKLVLQNPHLSLFKTDGNYILTTNNNSDKFTDYEAIISTTDSSESDLELERPTNKRGWLNEAAQSLMKVSFLKRTIGRKFEKMTLYGEYDANGREFNGRFSGISKALAKVRQFTGAYVSADFQKLAYQEIEGLDQKSINGRKTLKIGELIDLTDEGNEEVYNKALREAGLTKGNLFSKESLKSIGNIFSKGNRAEFIYDLTGAVVDLLTVNTLTSGAFTNLISNATDSTIVTNFTTLLQNTIRIGTPFINTFNDYNRRILSGKEAFGALSIGFVAGIANGMIGNWAFKDSQFLLKFGGKALLSLSFAGILNTIDRLFFDNKSEKIKSIRSRRLMESFSGGMAFQYLMQTGIFGDLSKVIDRTLNQSPISNIENVTYDSNGHINSIQKTQIFDIYTQNPNTKLEANLIPDDAHPGYFKIQGQETPFRFTEQDLANGTRPSMAIHEGKTYIWNEGEYVANTAENVSTREVRINMSPNGAVYDSIHEVEINAQGRPYLPNGYNMRDLNDLELGEGWSKYVKGGDLYVIDKDGNVFIPKNPYPGAELVEIRGTAIPREILLENQAVAGANPGAVIPEELRNGIPPKYITETVSAQSGVDNFIERAREAGRDLVEVNTGFGEGWIDTDPNGRFRVRSGLKVNDLVTGVWDDRGRLIGIRVEDTGGGSTGRVNFYRATNGPVVNGNAVFNVQQYLPGQPNNTQTVVWEIGVEQRGGILRLDDLTDRSNGQQLWNSGLNSPEANDFIGRGTTTKQVINPEYVELERKYGDLEKFTQQGGGQGGGGYVATDDDETFGVIKDILGPTAQWGADIAKDLAAQYNSLSDEQKLIVGPLLLGLTALGGVYIARKLDPSTKAKIRRDLDRLGNNIELENLTAEEQQKYGQILQKLRAGQPLDSVDRKWLRDITPAGRVSRFRNRGDRQSAEYQIQEIQKLSQDLSENLTADEKTALQAELSELNKALGQKGKLSKSQMDALNQRVDAFRQQKSDINSDLKIKIDNLKQRMDELEANGVAIPSVLQDKVNEYRNNLNNPNNILDKLKRDEINSNLQNQFDSLEEQFSKGESLTLYRDALNTIEADLDLTEPDTQDQLDRLKMKLASGELLDDDEKLILSELNKKATANKNAKLIRQDHENQVNQILADTDYDDLFASNPALKARLGDLQAKAQRSQLSDSELQELINARSDNFALKASRSKGSDATADIVKLRRSPLFSTLVTVDPGILDKIAEIELAIKNNTVNDTQIVELRKLHNKVISEQVSSVKDLDLKLVSKIDRSVAASIKDKAARAIFSDTDVSNAENLAKYIDQRKKLIENVKNSQGFLDALQKRELENILLEIELGNAEDSHFGRLSRMQSEAISIKEKQTNFITSVDTRGLDESQRQTLQNLEDRLRKGGLSPSEMEEVRKLRTEANNYISELKSLRQVVMKYKDMILDIDEQIFATLEDKASKGKLDKTKLLSLQQIGERSKGRYENKQISQQINSLGQIKIAGGITVNYGLPDDLRSDINTSDANLTQKRNLVNLYKKEFARKVRELNNSNKSRRTESDYAEDISKQARDYASQQVRKQIV